MSLAGRHGWVRVFGFVGASLVTACGSPNDAGNSGSSAAGAAGTGGALGTAGSKQGANGATATAGQPGLGGGAGNFASAGSGGAGGAGVSGGGSGSPGGGAGAADGGTAGTSAGGQAGVGGMPSAGTGGNSNSAGNGGAGLGGGSTGGMPGTGGPLPSGVTSLFPAPGATGVCLDAPLTLTFSSTPSVGSSGKISIFAKNSPNTAVDIVDVTTTKYTDTIGGQARNLVRPVFIDGKQAVVYFHQHKLAANTTYYVTVSSGAFVDSSKAALGAVSSPSAWSFTTGAAPSASASMSVNRTGSGDFCTVQGAFDAIPANSTTARTITVAANIYHEVLYLSAKKNLSLVGTDRANTIIEYPNNDNLNSGTSARPMFSVKGADNLTISTLTLYNTTPQNGSQAEALAVSADQVILRNANFKSLQDTLLLTGRVYVTNSYVEGNVDFVWGNGVTYFDNCELKTVGRAGAIVQSRNGANAYGYVFVDSKLTSDPGITGQVLARIDATQYPYSHVAYINCQMSSAIAPAGWTITPSGASTANLRFWEYQSTDANGNAIDVSGRVSKQINASQAATMRNKATVLGGWNPQ